MPLSKAKQAEYQRERRRKLKIPNVIPSTPSVIPKYKSVIPKIPELVMQGNRIVGMDKKTRYDADGIIPKLPICDERNFKQFKVGERVLMRRGRRLVETVIPELDADGNVIQN